MIETIKADIYLEGLRLIEEAEEKGLTLRLLGGLGIRHICPSATEEPWAREYEDIDFVASRSGRESLERFFEEQGYEPNKQRNLFAGDKRLLFYDHSHNRQLDIFIGVFDMCHFLELEERLRLTETALAPEDLFLTKIQIIELNQKDIYDLGLLLLDTEVGKGKKHKGALDTGYIARLCAKDWGWYKTVTKNIRELKHHLGKMPELSSEQKEKISAKLDLIENEIEKQPKSMAWKTRNLVGEKVQWYNLPEDLGK